MDFYFGPATLLLEGEEFCVTAFIDSARGGGIEDWGGYLETGECNDVLNLRAFGSDDVHIRILSAPTCDIGVEFIDDGGLTFTGLGASPLPAPAE